MHQKPPSLRTALLQAMLILSAGGVFTLIAITALSLRLTQQNLLNRQQRTIYAIAEQGQLYLSETNRLMQMLAGAAARLPSSEMQALLAETHRQYPRFLSLYLLDEAGIVVLEETAARSLYGLDLSGEPYFEETQETGETYFSEPYISPTTGQILLTAVAPIFVEGQFRGALVGEYSLERVQETIQTTNLHPRETFFIVDQNGTVIAHPNPTWVQQRYYLGDHPLVAAAKAETNVVRIYRDDEENVWAIGSATFIEPGWIFVNTQPLTAVAQPAIWTLSALLLALLVTGILFIYMRRRLTEQVSKPVVALAHTADALAQDASLPTPLTTPEVAGFREINSLNQSFDHMVNQLQTTILKLEQEIKDREKIEAALRTSEQRFRGVVEQSSDGIILANEEGRIVEWNEAVQDMTGLPETAVLGETFWEIQHQITAGDNQSHHFGRRLEAEYETFAADGSASWITQIQKLTIRHVNDSERIVQIGMFPIKTAHGYMAGSIIRDLTEWIRREEQIEQQNRLAAVGQLASGIAHDFNNILTAVILYTQITLRDPSLSANARQRLETVAQQADRAADLIQQILDFSRRAVLERQNLNLVSLLKEMVKLLQRTLPENISLSLLYNQKEDYIIHADPTRMQQVFMNLAVNARDAMSGGGHLSFHLNHLCLTEHDIFPHPELVEGEWIKIIIKDTGVGIESEALPRIFEPFFTTKAPGEGTGLGMAQVYGIVKQHEGNIFVESRVNEGTSFTIYLPAVTHFPPPLTADPEQPLATGKGELILLAEDNDAIQTALIESLNMLNYRVLATANGQEALATYQEQARSIVLVISDVVMPEMGGVELVKKIRQQDETIPIIMLTGHPQENISDLLPVVEWLPKPPTIEGLANTIALLLENQHAPA